MRIKLSLKQALTVMGAAATVAAFFIAPHEDIRFTAYQDSIGVWTICRGHTKHVHKGMTAIKEQCDEWYIEDVAEAQAAYRRLVSYGHSPNVEAAAISFIFNAGAGNFASSTLRKKLNAGDWRGACDQFPRWRYAGGKDCRVRANNCYGIVKRRQLEKELCLDPDHYYSPDIDFDNFSSGLRSAQL